ncbi:hypothetical protein ACLOJK_012928 [Asimina triloba]
MCATVPSFPIGGDQMLHLNGKFHGGQRSASGAEGLLQELKEKQLQDVVHSDKRLYLVFEYLDLDLKKHMDSCPELSKDPRLIKVAKEKVEEQQHNKRAGAEGEEEEDREKEQEK